MASPPFRFRRFLIDQSGVAHPAGTDGVLLGAWADLPSGGRVLDIGTGTGLIALFLAQRLESQPEVRVIGVELHRESFLCAQRNFAASPWRERLEAVPGSVQAYVAASPARFDLIVSNPPFFTETILSPDPIRNLGRQARSLPPGDLLDVVNALMAPQGRFCTILPTREGIRLCEWGATRGLYCTRITEVRTRWEKPVERLLLQFEHDPYPFQRDTLIVYEKGENHTAAFKELTRAFYLDFQDE